MYPIFTIARKYIYYLLTSSNRNGHGVHSPFVYEFISKVLNDKKEKEDYTNIEQLRNKLLANKNHIEVEDYGAGSAIVNTRIRRIDKIASSSLKSKKYAQLLYRIAGYYKPANILEIGTSFGITTCYLSKGNPDATIITLEGASSVADIAVMNFSKLSLNNIDLVRGEFGTSLFKAIERMNSIDLAFIDGNHRKQPTLDYFQHVLKHANDNTMIIFDDIHWSAEMESAWNEIKNHDSTTLTIDLFFFGIVFIKKDFKVKQHFSIQF